MQLRGANDQTVLTMALCIGCVPAISYDSGIYSVVFVASHKHGGSFHETLFAEAALARIGGAALPTTKPVWTLCCVTHQHRLSTRSSTFLPKIAF